MSLPHTEPASRLAEAKKLTLANHFVNVFRLVMKELRSIRADPTMLVLVVYAFSISVNTVRSGAIEMIAPTFKSWLGQPSNLLPIPVSLSTVE